MENHNDYKALFISVITSNFERSHHRGTVQLHFEQPDLACFVTLTDSSIACMDGVVDNPASTIQTSSQGLAYILDNRHSYDPRVVEFSSHLAVSGNRALALSLLDLVKAPAPYIEQMMRRAKDVQARKPVHSIRSIDYADRNAIHDAIANSEPALLTGMLEKWKVANWSPEFLKARFGTFKLSSYFSGTIGDFVTAMMSTETCADAQDEKYTNGVGLPGILWKHFPEPDVIRRLEKFGLPQLWLGSADSVEKPVTSLHCDSGHGFLCQVFGRKKFLLYSPDQEEFLYPVRAYNHYRPCWVGPGQSDDADFPLFKQARPIEVVVNPGEVLLIPLGWYHCVYALDPVMSITFPVQATPADGRLLQ